MNIECISCINWVRFSEILFEGLIVGITVIAAYIFGRMQSDRNWKREIVQREKEQAEAKHIDIDKVLMESLLKINYRLNHFLSYLSLTERKFIIENGIVNAGEGLLFQIKDESPLFPSNLEDEIRPLLDSIYDLITEWLPSLDKYSGLHILSFKPVDGYEPPDPEPNPRYLELKENYHHIQAFSSMLNVSIQDLRKEFG